MDSPDKMRRRGEGGAEVSQRDTTLLCQMAQQDYSNTFVTFLQVLNLGGLHVEAFNFPAFLHYPLGV